MLRDLDLGVMPQMVSSCVMVYIFMPMCHVSPVFGQATTTSSTNSTYDCKEVQKELEEIKDMIGKAVIVNKEWVIILALLVIVFFCIKMIVDSHRFRSRMKYMNRWEKFYLLSEHENVVISQYPGHED